VKDADNECPNLISPYITIDNLEAHHLIEKRFAKTLGIDDEDSMPAVLMTRKQHDDWTRRLQSEGLPVGSSYELQEIWDLYTKVYISQPDWMDAVRAQWSQR
jgi:hypothetical protein